MINLSKKTIYGICGSLCLLVVAGILLSLFFSDKISATAASVIVKDGDTIEINGQLLRILGIDAPEPGQVAINSQGRHDIGGVSSAGLSDLISKYTNIVCEPARMSAVAEELEDLDAQNGERLARCYGVYDGNKDSLGQNMVAEGLAYATPSLPIFKEEEHMAEIKEVGVWGDYEARRPLEYRKAREEAKKNPLYAELGVIPANSDIVVIDGDTLVLKGRHVRLAGIDAPELGQLGFTGRGYDAFVENSYDVGQKTAAALRAAIFGRNGYLFLKCLEKDPGDAVSGDTGPDEVVATCVGIRPRRDEDLGRYLVTEGLAWSVSEKYRPAENISRGSSRNIWKRDANIRDLPWTYRKKYVSSDAKF